MILDYWLLVSSQGRKGEGALCCLLYINALIPFQRAQLSWPGGSQRTHLISSLQFKNFGMQELVGEGSDDDMTQKHSDDSTLILEQPELLMVCSFHHSALNTFQNSAIKTQNKISNPQSSEEDLTPRCSTLYCATWILKRNALFCGVWFLLNAFCVCGGGSPFYNDWDIIHMP